MSSLLKVLLLLSLSLTFGGCAAMGQSGAVKTVYDTGDAALNTQLLMRKNGFETKSRTLSEEAEKRFNPPMTLKINPAEAMPKLRGLSLLSSYGAQYAQSSQMESGVQVYRPFSNAGQRPAMRHSQPAPRMMPQSSPLPPPVPAYVFENSMRIQPQSEFLQTQIESSAPIENPVADDEYSYVKMGGGSDISDWQTCEAEAGGFVLAGAVGYSIDPNFDSCMRVRGYKPESEAQADLTSE